MSTTLTLRPDTTDTVAGWTIGGGAGTHHAAQGDDSDATYSISAGATASLVVGFSTAAIPATAQIRSVTPRIRFGDDPAGAPIPSTLRWRLAISGDSSLPVESRSPQLFGTPEDVIANAQTKDPLGGYLSVADISLLQLRLQRDSANAPRVYETFLDVVYNEMPTLTYLAPLAGATVAGGKPTVRWTYADPEGDVQERYQVKVFTQAQYEAAGFNPATSVAAYDSGVVYSSSAQHKLATALAAGVHRVYARVADVGSNGRYSAWTSAQFTVSIDLPSALTLGTTPDVATGSVLLTATASDNLLSYFASTAEPTNAVYTNPKIGNWQLDVNATGGASGGFNWVIITSAPPVVAPHGTRAFRVNSAAAGAFSAATHGFAKVVAGTTYTALGSLLAGTAARSGRMRIRWYDAALALLSTSDGATTALSTVAWTAMTCAAAAPANAVFAKVVVECTNAGAAAEALYFDRLSLRPGATGTTWSRGGLAAYNRLDYYTSSQADWANNSTATSPNLAADPTGEWFDNVNASNVARVLTADGNATNGLEYQLEWSPDADGTTQVRTPTGVDGIRVIPGKSYVFQGKLRVTTGTAKNARLWITWNDREGNRISYSSSALTALAVSPTAHTDLAAVGVAPAKAAYATLSVSVYDGLNADVYRGGNWLFGEGTAALPWQAGQEALAKYAVFEVSDDLGVTWTTLPGGSAVPFDDLQVASVRDYTGPPGVTRQYRVHVLADVIV